MKEEYLAFRAFYEPLMFAPCPKTEMAMKKGLAQKSGGYISFAKKCGIPISPETGSPAQGWHFLRSYLDRTDPNKARIGNILCSELWIWLAEISNAVPNNELDDLIEKASHLDRRNANSLIRSALSPKVFDIVMSAYNAG